MSTLLMIGLHPWSALMKSYLLPILSLIPLQLQTLVIFERTLCGIQKQWCMQENNICFTNKNLKSVIYIFFFVFIQPTNILPILLCKIPQIQFEYREGRFVLPKIHTNSFKCYVHM